MTADTRERILRAAMELFWEKGYQSTSMADLFARAGINSGSLYHFFPGKQDVLVAVLTAYRDGIGPMLLEPAWAAESDPIERVFALLDRYRTLIVQTDCTYGCPIGSIALELHEPDPAVRELLAENFKAWAQAVERQLDAAGGRLSADVDRAALAEFVLTTMEGAVMLTRTHRDVAYFDRAIGQLREYFGRLVQPVQRTARTRAAVAPRPSRARPRSRRRSPR